MTRILLPILLFISIVLVSCRATAEPEVATAGASVSPPAEVVETATEIAIEMATEVPATASATPAPTNTALPTDRPTAAATPEMEPGLPAGEIFTEVGQEPIVEHGPAGSWDGQFTDPGALVVHEGTFHMFRNGFVGWPAEVAVGYVQSADGDEWTEVTEEPVLDPEGAPNVPFTALASSALVEEDGTWVLYLYTWDARLPANRAGSSIVRATAPEPTGPWTFDAEPLLVPGDEEAWDSLAVRAPSVVRVEGRYLMFYSGYTQNGMSIGLATSEDGLTWEKYDDPETTEAPFAESDPVFESGKAGSWDDAFVYQPRVVAVPEGLFMIYSSSEQVGGGNARLGYAFSEDGVQWVRSEEAVLERGAIEGALAIWYTALAYHEGRYLLVLEIGTGGETALYLATREEPLVLP